MSVWTVSSAIGVPTVRTSAQPTAPHNVTQDLVDVWTALLELGGPTARNAVTTLALGHVPLGMDTERTAQEDTTVQIVIRVVSSKDV